MDSARLQPALLGGLFIGVLSALPIINLGNCCCCLWVIGGGVLAVYLRQQNLAFQIDAAEAALMGLMAGVIGGVVWGVLSIPINMFMGPMQAEWMGRIFEANEDMPPEMRENLQRMMAGSGVQIVGIIINVFISAIFGLIGGLLGMAIFKKNVPPPTPPPPPPSGDTLHAPYSGQ